MKVGLYFGSFNPIHIGHLIIANHVINCTPFKKVWFVVSPQNPLKKSQILLNEYQRLHLVRLATEDDANLKVTDIEFKLPKPSYTIDTLTHLTEKYPDNEFAVIMGSDSFSNLSKWKNYQQLMANYKIIVYNRPRHELTELIDNHILLKDAPLLDISATLIRQLVKENKSIKYLVPEKVKDEIEICGYYKKH